MQIDANARTTPKAPAMLAAGMVAAAVIAVLLAAAFAPATAFADEPTSGGAKAKAAKPVEITISAVGDCTLGVDSRYNSVFNSYYKRKGAAYFLKKVRPVFAKDDLTIVNFEGTLTTAKSRADKAFTFKGPAKLNCLPFLGQEKWEASLCLEDRFTMRGFDGAPSNSTRKATGAT